MATPHFIADCPRCGANHITFDHLSHVHTGNGYRDWQRVYEVPAKCRACDRPTTWKMTLHDYKLSTVVQQADFWNQIFSLNKAFEIEGYISLKDNEGVACPEHVPENVTKIFDEGSACRAIGAPNAAAAMFRLCLDLVTKALLPDPTNENIQQPSRDQRKRLFDRLTWLFEHQLLPDDLKELADGIRNDGNDGAHDGTLELIDADDLLDFTVAMLERIYTQPERVKLARQRTLERRAKLQS